MKKNRKLSLKQIEDFQGSKAAQHLIQSQEFLKKAGDCLVRNDLAGFEEFMMEATTDMSIARWHAARNSGVRLATVGTPENEELVNNKA